MLTRLEFLIDDKESDVEQFGCHYERVVEEYKGKELDFIFTTVDTTHHIWKDMYDEPVDRFHTIGAIGEERPGVYLSSSLNFHNHIESLTKYEDSHDYALIHKLTNIDDKFLSTHGVAADIEEVLEYYKAQLSSDIPFCISFCPIRKQDQPEEGGWRWHKWGEVVGKLQPTTEYLYDEPEIEEVIVFQLHVLEEQK